MVHSWFKFLIAFFGNLVFVFYADTCCNELSIYYEIQSPDHLAGNTLRYLMKNIEFARAVKYNTFEGFVMLDDSWTASPSVEPDNSNIWITQYERKFSETIEVRSTIPTNFGAGSSLDVVFRTSSVVHNWFSINIENPITDTVYLHMDIRPSWNEVYFNSRHGSSWDSEVNMTNPVHQEDSIYIATFIYTSFSWNIYINGSQIYSFPHRYDYGNDDEVKFSGTDTICLRMIFYGPF